MSNLFQRSTNEKSKLYTGQSDMKDFRTIILPTGFENNNSLVCMRRKSCILIKHFDNLMS